MFTQILGSTYIWSLSDKINACVAIGTVALAGTAIYQLKLLRDQIKAQWIEIKSSKEAEQKAHAYNKAKNTWDIIESIFNDKNSFDALHLIEYDYYHYNTHYSSDLIQIKWEQVFEALRLDGNYHFDGMEIFIKEICFDNLLRKLDRLEHAMRHELAAWDHVDPILKYYIKMIRRPRSKERISSYCKVAMPNAFQLIIDELKYST